MWESRRAAQNNLIWGAVLSEDGVLLVSGGGDRVLRVWRESGTIGAGIIATELMGVPAAEQGPGHHNAGLESASSAAGDFEYEVHLKRLSQQV